MHQVSVIVPCHDATATLPLQLEALARQEGAPDFEVVLVDNRSRDALTGLAAQWQARVPGLQVVAATARAGAGYARNVGVAKSSGERLLFCDADDVVARDWVAAGAAALDEVELACGMDVTLADREFTTVEQVWRTRLDSLPGGRLQRAAGPTAYPIVLGGNLAIRRETYCAIGGFDASLVRGNEDNDFAVRAQQHGFLIHRAPAMRIAIRQRADLRSSFRRARLAGRGHIELCDRHGLRDTSPHLRGQAWRLDLPRAAAAGALMWRRPGAQRDWHAVAVRLGVGLGLWEGDIRALTRRRSEPAIGEGLQE
ncbi:glycosyltransferase [Calidifontibacter sp. DB0510]|uniref:Glycosyltransferase n=1 Tax=Metallococcus carri TaxID=1656884 RepID=A0A967EB44_9MICO|nr:glycosyltransferase [Metallococcus carri]NHN56569.1 glycosyltransferase [Metallococcus carri]NOP38868.1 glycosyltransferase [Calidifontibacter sp. DB2511S]